MPRENINDQVLICNVDFRQSTLKIRFKFYVGENLQ